MAEQVAVGDANTECIGGPVGEPFNRKARWVYGVAAERLRQSLVDEGDIGSILTEDYIPCLAARIRRK